MKKNRKRMLAIAGAVVIIAATVALVFFLKQKDGDDRKQETVADYRPIEETQKEIDAYVADQAAKAEQIASRVQQPSDLDSYSVSEQAAAGLKIIYDSMNSGDTAKAKAFAGYLMKRNDADGLLASKLCYKLASSDAEKQDCKDRAVEQARDQGIISQDQTLPDSYMELKEGDE